MENRTEYLKHMAKLAQLAKPTSQAERGVSIQSKARLAQQQIEKEAVAKFDNAIKEVRSIIKTGKNLHKKPATLRLCELVTDKTTGELMPVVFVKAATKATRRAKRRDPSRPWR